MSCLHTDTNLRYVRNFAHFSCTQVRTISETSNSDRPILGRFFEVSHRNYQLPCFEVKVCLSVINGRLRPRQRVAGRSDFNFPDAVARLCALLFYEFRAIPCHSGSDPLSAQYLNQCLSASGDPVLRLWKLRSGARPAKTQALAGWGYGS